MAKVTLTLNGFDAVKAAVARSPETVKALAGDAVARSTFAIAQRARSLVAVDTGRLKGSIASSSTGTNGRVGFGTGLYYWRFVEFGTINVAARPFLRPAAEEESDVFLKRMRDIGPKLERDFAAGGLR